MPEHETPEDVSIGVPRFDGAGDVEIRVPAFPRSRTLGGGEWKPAPEPYLPEADPWKSPEPEPNVVIVPASFADVLTGMGGSSM